MLIICVACRYIKLFNVHVGIVEWNKLKVPIKQYFDVTVPLFSILNIPSQEAPYMNKSGHTKTCLHLHVYIPMQFFKRSKGLSH